MERSRLERDGHTYLWWPFGIQEKVKVVVTDYNSDVVVVPTTTRCDRSCIQSISYSRKFRLLITARLPSLTRKTGARNNCRVPSARGWLVLFEQNLQKQPLSIYNTVLTVLLLSVATNVVHSLTHSALSGLVVVCCFDCPAGGADWQQTIDITAAVMQINCLLWVPSCLYFKYI